jgi:hypothetical protein
MRCNHLDRSVPLGRPPIARFWDALVAEQDNTPPAQRCRQNAKTSPQLPQPVVLYVRPVSLQFPVTSRF